MFRAIATDLDGTLLDADSRVNARSWQALRRAAAAGCQLIVATGRHHRDVREILAAGSDLSISVISANGARVHAQDDRQLHAANLTPALVNKLLQPALAGDAEMGLYLDSQRLACRYHGPLQAYAGKAEQVESLADYHGSGVAKIIYYAAPDKLTAIEQEILHRFEGQLALVYSQDCYLEVMAPGVSKGSALSLLLAELGIAAEHCAAFGDAQNDVEMLRLVGHPHRMANASPRLSGQVPQARQIGHHAESAVARVLEQAFA
ncbi:HAD family hydrolase [Vogesella oryzae]|uniref:HAD family hydrolase n=1 Tax=Vogesella oryzae TaxID=1735285 RepID=UPI001582AA9C|nr:HAD family hydrolase [Vogesella oryzae]